MAKLYSSTAVSEFIEKYVAKGGFIEQVSEGVLGHGEMVLFGNGLKTVVVKEVYINQWSSGHSIRMYNKTPKKYLEYTGG